MTKNLLIITLFFGFTVVANELDSASTEALSKTQSLMNSSEQRNAYIKDHPDAQAADKKVDDLTSDPNVKNQVYSTSSDIYGDMVKKTGGDTDKQKQMLDDAMKDPEAFYKELTPEQQQQIRDLAGKAQQEHPMNDSRY